MIADLLQNKTTAEKSQIKSGEIVKVDFKGILTEEKYGVDIEIQSVKSIDGGVEVIARAWKGATQYGFGKSGNIEFERFRIFNPPVKVPDGTKRTVVNELGKTVELDNFKEDPKQAILLSISHAVKVSGKLGFSIKKGTVGNTTDTYYPDAGHTSTTVDGLLKKESKASWALVINTDDATSVDTDSATTGFIQYSWFSGGVYGGYRAVYTFNTANIGSDTVDSATFSVYGNDKSASGGSTNLFSATPASSNNLVVGDWDQVGSTAFSTAISQASWSTSAYNDFALNASGLANIATGGISKFALRHDFDYNSSAPTGTGTDLSGYWADQTGTTNDPKLVVVHTAASGPASLKTWDGLAKASVKTMDGLAIASVKTWNGLT